MSADAGAGPDRAVPVVLEVENGPKVVDPEPATVVDAVEEALIVGRFVIMERGTSWVQGVADTRPVSGFGMSYRPDPGRPRYAVEYRDGTAPIYRYETEDIAEVVGVFSAFARGDEGYRASEGWKVHLRP